MSITKLTTTRYEVSMLKDEIAKIKANLSKNNILTILTFGLVLVLTLFVSILFFGVMNKSIQVHLENNNNTSVEQKGSLSNANDSTSVNNNNSLAGSSSNANLEQKKGFINK